MPPRRAAAAVAAVVAPAEWACARVVVNITLVVWPSTECVDVCGVTRRRRRAI